MINAALIISLFNAQEKSPNAQLTDTCRYVQFAPTRLVKKPNDFQVPMPLRQLQAESKPVIEAKDASDAKSTKTIKRKPKKKRSKKGKKKVVGTKEDPITIKEINEDSDDSSLSECTQNPPKVVRKKVPKELQKVVGNQVAKVSPKVVDISAPKAPPWNKANTHKPGVYSASKVETQVQNKVIHLGKETQVAK